jgi:hypothetical protein
MTSIVDRIVKWQGSTTPSETYDFCDLICRAYEDADGDLRAELRQAVAANKKVSSSLLNDSLDEFAAGGYLVEMAKRAKKTGDYSIYLRSALLAISITDGFEDSRDTLMWLADLWRDSEEQGMDPSPHFRAIGKISSTETVHMIGGPTAAMILQMFDERRRNELRWS